MSFDRDDFDVIDMDLEDLKKDLWINIGDEELFRKIVGGNVEDFKKDEFIILKTESCFNNTIYLILEAHRGELRFRVDSYDDETDINIKSIIEPFGRETYLDMLTSFDAEILRIKRLQLIEDLNIDI